MSLGESIRKLREEGLSYNQIVERLGCAKSTVCYHLGDGQKKKNKDRNQKHRKNNPILKKVQVFCEKVIPKEKIEPTRPVRQIISGKISQFHSTGDKVGRKYSPRTFSVKEAMKIIKERGVCYLTGEEIDIEDTESYQFDHIKPRTGGGENTVENLGITTKHANYAKGSMEFEDFIKMCHKIAERYPDLDNLEPKHTRG